MEYAVWTSDDGYSLPGEVVQVIGKEGNSYRIRTRGDSGMFDGDMFAQEHELTFGAAPVSDIVPGLVRVTFRKVHTQLVIHSEDLPLPGAKVLSQDCRKGVVHDLTPAQVSIRWDDVGMRTYTDIVFDDII